MKQEMNVRGVDIATRVFHAALSFLSPMAHRREACSITPNSTVTRSMPITVRSPAGTW